MNLHIPLELKQATTAEVNLVPTKPFFKPVLVIECAITKDEAVIFGAGWMFDVNGNPHNFDNAVKIHGDLPQAQVTIAGRAYQVEKVAHFSVARVEKKNAVLTLRIHFSEDEPVTGLLEYLASINKDPFPVTIMDRQLSFVSSGVVGREDPGWKPAEPDADGKFDMRRATSRPFSHKLLSASIFYLETAEGFRAGWSFICRFAEPWEGGEVISISSRAYAAESESVEAGGRLIWSQLELLRPGAKAEVKALVMLKEYLIDISPAIAAPAVDLEALHEHEPPPEEPR